MASEPGSLEHGRLGTSKPGSLEHGNLRALELGAWEPWSRGSSAWEPGSLRA